MAVTKPISGIIGACLTPFDEDDRIDYKALEREIEFIVNDCDAITVAAVEAAEYTMLSREERKELLKVATEMIGKRVPVILGCSSPSPREVIELAEYSAQGRRRFRPGADAASPLGRAADHRRADGILYSSCGGEPAAGYVLSQPRARRRSAAGCFRQDQRDR